jgi:hypothetical protein
MIGKTCILCKRNEASTFFYFILGKLKRFKINQVQVCWILFRTLPMLQMPH